MRNLLPLIRYLKSFRKGKKICLTLDAVITEDGLLLADLVPSPDDDDTDVHDTVVLHLRVDLTDVDMVVMDPALPDAISMLADATNDPDYNLN